MQIAIGIDSSLSNTALCFYSPSQATTPHTECRNAGPVAPGMARFRRYEQLVNAIVDLCGEATPGIVTIEGYSYASKGRAILTMAEFGGLLRYRLALFDPIEVSPAELKKWATGKGNANKTQVVVALTRRYGVEYSTDDEYDAFALAKIGAQYRGWEEPKAVSERAVVQKLGERMSKSRDCD